MQRKSIPVRNKLMVACSFAVACALATPAVFAHDRHAHSRDRNADVLGALVVGAVIGGVLVSASQSHAGYTTGYSYSPPAYPPASYYGGGPAYSYGPADSYADGYAYPGYASGVSIGVVYSDHDHGSRHHYREERPYYGGRHEYYGNGGSYRHDVHHGSPDRGHYYRRGGH